jgi:hypothetical protein
MSQFLFFTIIIAAFAYFLYQYNKSKKIKQKLNEIFEMSKEIKEEINKYESSPTIVKFSFIKIGKSKKKYKNIKFSWSNREYSIEPGKEIQLELNDIPDYKFEVSKSITLKNGNHEKEFLIKINLHQTNHYYIKINYNKKEKYYSLETIFYSRIKKLLPKEIDIEGVKIKDSEKYDFEDRKRFVILNIEKDVVLNFCNNNINNQLDGDNLIFDYNDLFFNVILKENEKVGKIFVNEKNYEIIEFTEKEKVYVNEFYDSIKPFLVLDEKNNFDNELTFELKLDKYINNNLTREICDKFTSIPYFLKYNHSDPDLEELLFVEKLCFLKCINISSFKEKEAKSYQVFEKFLSLKNYIFTKVNNDKFFTIKDKILILLNISAFIFEFCLLNSYKYDIIKMEDLPEFSPYIQSEKLYRDVISKLTNKSKLSFLFLQLNSGGSNEFISNQSWYKLKMIPLIEIKRHLLNEYYPYFFIYDIAHEALALNSSQTLIKSFNESCLKRYENIFIKEKSIKDTESTDNTIKIFFLKFHENGHSKYKGNLRLEKSPRFILKNNLRTLDNDFNKITTTILKGEMK